MTKTGGPAFCSVTREAVGTLNGAPQMRDFYSPGMTLHQYYMGQALANPQLCTGTEPEWQLQVWFGDRGGITRAEIVSAQARTYADAMIAERERTND